MKKKKFDWIAITAIVTIIATAISFLVFLFGEGVIHKSSLPKPQILETPNIQTQSTIDYATEIPYQKVEIKQSVSSLNKSTTVMINYLEFQKNTVLLNLTYDNSQNILNELACGLPKLIKSQYGDLGDVVEKGGLFFYFSKFCPIIVANNIISMRSKEDGWLVFQIDPTHFTVNGLYTIANLGYYIPTITFEINSTP